MKKWLSRLLSPSDEQLMGRVQGEDDAEAFAELMRRWEAPLQRLCTRMTGDWQQAEDLTQEAFSRVYARRRLYRAESRFSTYLWRIAINLCYNELRRSKTKNLASFGEPACEGASPTEMLASEEPDPHQQLTEKESSRAVRQAILALSEDHRAVVLLRHYENLKFREIAEVLGLPEGTVKTRMCEALNQLARALRRTLEVQTSLGAGRRSKPILICAL
jgi:RNA polymerase sigma-70 factor (ECF subfamily)